MEQENRPKIKKLIKCYKGKLSQNQSQIRNTRKVIIRQNIDKHECNNKDTTNFCLQYSSYITHAHYFS